MDEQEEREQTREDKESRMMGDLQEDEYTVVGSDSEALYPSLSPERTGECVRLVAVESDVRWEGVDYLECLRYIRMNCDPWETKKMGIDHLMPRKKYTKEGTRGSVGRTAWTVSPRGSLSGSSPGRSSATKRRGR